MIRRALALVLAISITAKLPGQTTTMSFAGLKWGSSRELVKQTLSPLGYTFTKLDDDGDLNYKGELLGYPATMFFMFTASGALAQVQLTILTPNAKNRETYNQMKASLTQKYGQPSDDFHFFETPYYEGDGYEDQAMRLGKAHFACFWKHQGVKGDEVAGLSITPALNLHVIYEGPAWSAESDRRRAILTKVF